MTPFTISSNPPFLTRDIQAFYHTNFYGAEHPENPNYLYKFKNDPHHNWTDYHLQQATDQLSRVLSIDLPQIQQQIQINPLTVCVVPRAKADNTYRPNQLLFKATIKAIVNQLDGFEDGTDYIKRHTNTKTTHIRRPMDGFVNDGNSPYAGITRDTCRISNNVNGKNILLIDDIYTKTVNIDEDAIQALISKGASSVIFYAVGNTVSKA
jgi:phosphoribosylpyrophosphate synthetase